MNTVTYKTDLHMHTKPYRTKMVTEAIEVYLTLSNYTAHKWGGSDTMNTHEFLTRCYTRKRLYLDHGSYEVNTLLKKRKTLDCMTYVHS